MKFLRILQKQKIVWYLLAVCTVFIILRGPSLIEPDWYGDEGIYQVVGQALNDHRLLYRDIWDNKPPLLYLIYALVNGDLTSIKTLSLFFGMGSLIALFFLTQKLYNKRIITFIVTLLYSVLFAMPLIEGDIANAENFMLLPTILAGFLIYSSTQKKHLSPLTSYYSFLISGLLLGIAFLFKIVAVFDMVAFILYLGIVTKLQKNSLKHFSLIKRYALLLFAFVVPLLVAIMYFTSVHGLSDFLHAAFAGNVAYVGFENTLFGIPQGLLIAKIILLSIAVGIVIWKRRKFSQAALFVTLWFLFSLFNSFFSGRPYTHYVLNLLPSFCLLVGFAIYITAKRIRFFIITVLLATVGVIYLHFTFYIPKAFLYYNNAFQFILGNKTVTDYQSFFDIKTPRDYAVASFIKQQSLKKNDVYIWGDHPQIYALSHTLPLTKYTVAYHVITSNKAIEQTQQTILKKTPRYVIVLEEAPPLPFSLPLYIMRFRMEGATIYERSF